MSSFVPGPTSLHGNVAILQAAKHTRVKCKRAELQHRPRPALRRGHVCSGQESLDFACHVHVFCVKARARPVRCVPGKQFSQLCETSGRKIIFDCSVLPEGIDHGLHSTA